MLYHCTPVCSIADAETNSAFYPCRAVRKHTSTRLVNTAREHGCHFGHLCIIQAMLVTCATPGVVQPENNYGVIINNCPWTRALGTYYPCSRPLSTAVNTGSMNKRPWYSVYTEPNRETLWISGAVFLRAGVLPVAQRQRTTSRHRSLDSSFLG